jgi:hypothetical protein
MYDNCLAEVENIRQFADLQKDVDYEEHVNALTKSHLDKTEWKLEPLQNPDNNFVESLIERYRVDLDSRQVNDNTVSDQIRKVI